MPRDTKSLPCLCRTKQEKLQCASCVTGVVIFTAFIFLLTFGFLMTFSYAVNSRCYNMSDGCPLFDSNCSEPIAIYKHGDAATLLGWTSLLVLIELGLVFGLGMLWTLIKSRFDPVRTKYTLVDELPSVPSDTVDSL